MSADRETPEQDNLTDPGNDQNLLASSLLDLMMRDAIADLDDIEEPRAADLAALDELEEPSADELAALEDIEEPTAAELAALDDVGDAAESHAAEPAQQPALALLTAIEEPELVSLESLDDAKKIETLDEDLMEEDETLDEPLDNFADIELDDEDLDDEGYDLDDEDIVHFQDLYGEDGDIIPSFREGEADDEDESGIAYYDDLR